MIKTPKTLLDELHVQLRNKWSGAKLNFKSNEIGNGKFSCVCTWTRMDDILEGTGEGQGKKNAEHAAASDILQQLEVKRLAPASPAESPNCEAPSGDTVHQGNSKTSPDLHALNNSQPIADDVTESSTLLEDTDLVVIVTDSVRNYVGRLQEHCAQNGFTIPVYSKPERSYAVDKSLIFKTFCTAAGITKSGEAKKVMISKKIAAAKVLMELGLEEVLVDQLADSLKGVSVNSHGTETKKEAKEDSIQISDKIWYFPDKILGSGGFSKVYEGYKEVQTCRVAIKQVNKEDVADPKNKELDILISVKHENLVEYYFREEVGGFVYFVMELAHSTLERWIKNESREYETLVKICKDVSQGLKELHKRSVVHRDIKPSNVLIFLDFTTAGVTPKAKLTDFGISRVINGSPEGVHTTGGMLGTMSYLPPEVNVNMKLNPSFDIFQLGLLFTFTMTRGRHLYEWPGRIELHQIQAKIVDDQPNWSVVDDQKLTPLKNILQVMMSPDPEKRSEVRVLLEHPFFWSYKESLEFIVAVSNDSKNGGSFNPAVSSAAQGFLKDMPDWKIRLDKKIQDWMTQKDKILEESKKKGSLQAGWRKYSGTSIIQLINFIRDQQQHNLNWKRTELEAEDVFGRDGRNYGAYFIKTFPELPTLLYNVLQDSHFQGPGTKKYFEKNTSKCFSLH